MKINFICGGISSGKTHKCIEIIGELKKKQKNVMLIVPEQYSYAAERLITENFNGTGINNIEVITFTRMAKRYLSRARKNYLSEAGKAILITKAAASVCDEKNVYAGCAEKPGFANSVSQMITELKRYMITPEMLINTAKKLGDGMLKHKITSIASIYEKYEELNGGRFNESEEDLLKLTDVIAGSDIFNDTYVFIDEFSDFLPQHYKVISALMSKCRELYVTLPVKKESLPFTIPMDTKNRLSIMAKKQGLDICEINMENDGRSFKSEEILFLYNNYSRFNSREFVPYPDTTNDISLFSAKDPYSEIEYTAKRITSLIAKGGYRYSDITVVCGNKESISSVIQAAFTDYAIPYFIDSKLEITDHPIIITVLSVFDIITSNWSYDAVFGYLKSGFIYNNDDEKISPINEDDIDFLSSFVLKNGIRGKKKWIGADDWRYNSAGLSEAVNGSELRENEEADERINSLRRCVTKPIEKFIEKTKGRRYVKELARALFEFMLEIHLYEGLQIEIQRLNEIGMRNEAEQFSKVWNTLIEVIDQTVTTLGDNQCSKEEFRSYLLAGLGECSIGIIPSSVDCVTITDADASVQKKTKVLFVMGAIRGDIPAEMKKEGMLSDKERTELFEKLEDDGFETVQTDSAEASEYRFYKLLFNAEEKIYISYPVSNFEGEAQLPAQLAGDLTKIFKRLSCYDDLISDYISEDISYSPKAAFDYLLQNRNNKNNSSVPKLYKWFDEHEEWHEKLAMAQLADSYKINEARITPDNAVELYKNKTTYSVSRLNEFSQCPFRYFAKNGLKAKEEEVWQIQKFDLGSLMHYAMCKFCMTVEENTVGPEELKDKWNSLTREECERLLDDIMSDMSQKISSAIDRDEGKVNYLLQRMTKTLRRSVETVRKSLSAGEYIPSEYEKEFEIPIDNELKIKGVIDRIDVAFDEEDKKAAIRVIDYKSGKKKFSVASLCNMIDIQLIVYAIAASELYDGNALKYAKEDYFGAVTGVMYNKLRDDFVRADKAGDEESIENEMKMNGLIVLEENENGDPKLDNAFLMDKNILTAGSSDFLNFQLTKAGKISSFSEYITRDNFDKLLEYARNNVKKYNKRIRGGDIKILPYKDNETMSCKYCEMAEICLFDSDRDEARILCRNDDEAWSIIENDIKDKYTERKK